MKASLLNAVCEPGCTIEKEIYITKRKKPRLPQQASQALDRSLISETAVEKYSSWQTCLSMSEASATPCLPVLEKKREGGP